MLYRIINHKQNILKHNSINDFIKMCSYVSDYSRTRRDEQRRKYSKIDKRAKDKLVSSPGENGGGQDAQKELHSRNGRDEAKGKTQEEKERGSRKRSSSAGSEKMERVGGR